MKLELQKKIKVASVDEETELPKGTIVELVNSLGSMYRVQTLDKKFRFVGPSRMFKWVRDYREVDDG